MKQDLRIPVKLEACTQYDSRHNFKLYKKKVNFYYFFAFLIHPSYIKWPYLFPNLGNKTEIIVILFP